MVKKIALILSVILSLSLVAFADNHLVDDAGIFSNDAEIESRLSALSSKHDIPIYLVTTDKYYDSDVRTASDYMLADRVGFNNDGMLLSINMASRDIYFTVSGRMMDESNISESQIREVHESVGKYLSKGKYDEGAEHYCDVISDILRGNYLSLMDALIAFGTSLFGVGGYGLYQHKKYNPTPRRKEYLVASGAVCNFVNIDDRFISERTVVTAKASSSSSSSSSHTTGGGSFRGGGSKF